jgi:hypothetical protein
MSAPELVAGYVVAGKYTIRSLLRHGGPTATYRSIAAKNREVALKIYDPAILGFPDLLKTLAQHKSIAAKLPPQQVVPIADSGTDSNSGAPFTVTDFESAPSLAQLIDRGPLSAAEMVALVRNLARAIDLLHSSGVASLTLHPSNVFIRPNTQYEARVADFGASLVRSALPAPEKAGRWMPWLAPEQIKGQTPPTQACDVFALGLIAFFAVTGKLYWRSSQMKTPDMAALRREILGERMPASVRAGEFSITLNPAVDTVLARALGFRPADRYSTAQEFAAGLDAAISGRPVAEVEVARPPAANVAAATVKAEGAAPAAHRASSSGEEVPAAQRMAPPPPRKMLLRSTMVGMGSPPADEPPAAAGPRPKLNTMLGMGAPAAEAVAAASAKAAPSAASPPVKMSAPAPTTAPARVAPPAKTTAPAMTAAPVKASPPAMPAPTAVRPAGSVTAVAPAMVPPPTMPLAYAMPAETPRVALPVTNTQRGLPPPLPMAPPPAQMEQVLAQFEASAPDRSPVTASPAAPFIEHADVVQTPPAWSAAQQVDAGAERVETGVAVIGADLTYPPRKNSRFRWVASICGLLVLTGAAAWALSSRSTSASRGSAASDAKATAPPTATTASPISAESPGAAVEPPTANAVPQGAEEARIGTELEPAVAVPPPAPPAHEPETPEPAPPVADSNAAEQPAIATGKSAPNQIPAAQGAPAAPRTPSSQKPCGKFLKRCK